MDITDKFYETFDISMIEWEEPARMEDTDGNIAAWYVNKERPSIDPIFMDLLDLGSCWDEKLLTYKKELKEKLITSLLNIYNNLNEQEQKVFKEDVKETFEAYYDFGEEDCTI